MEARWAVGRFGKLSTRPFQPVRVPGGGRQARTLGGSPRSGILFLERTRARPCRRAGLEAERRVDSGGRPWLDGPGLLRRQTLRDAAH